MKNEGVATGRSHCGNVDWVSITLKTSSFLFLLGWGLWLTGRLGTHTGAWLLVFGGWEHVLIGPNERKLGWVLLTLAPLIWVPRLSVIALLVGLLVFADAWMGRIVGGYSFSVWTPGAHAARYLPLIALFLWQYWGRHSPLGSRVTEWVLRIAIATVFTVHGLEAWYQHPGFTDYIIGTADGLLGLDWDENQVVWILKTIGVVDVAVAAAILFSTNRFLIGWLCFWGLITAFARMTTHGTEVYFEVLLRSGHYLGPLAIALIHGQRTRKPASSE